MKYAHGPSILFGALIAAVLMGWALNPTRLQKKVNESKKLQLHEARLDQLILRVHSTREELRCNRPHFEDWDCKKRHYPTKCYRVHKKAKSGHVVVWTQIDNTVNNPKRTHRYRPKICYYCRHRKQYPLHRIR